MVEYKFLITEVKVGIYKAMVSPILTYAAETRPDPGKTWKILETAKMKTLRKILDLSLFDKQRRKF